MALRLNERWADHAACKGFREQHGTDKWNQIWFPERGDAARSSIRQAKKICAGCPVVDECLQYALDAGLTIGVWGGKSANERRQLRSMSNTFRRPRQVELQPCGTDAAYRRHLFHNEKPCADCRAAHVRRWLEIKKRAAE